MMGSEKADSEGRMHRTTAGKQGDVRRRGDWGCLLPMDLGQIQMADTSPLPVGIESLGLGQILMADTSPLPVGIESLGLGGGPVSVFPDEIHRAEFGLTGDIVTGGCWHHQYRYAL